jgi:putative spermidine/putrescine transport system substrate-binding protein
VDTSRGWLRGKGLTRRELLRAAGLAAGAVALGTGAAGCGPNAPAVGPASAPSGQRTDIFMGVYPDYEDFVRREWVPKLEQALPVKMYVEPGVSADSLAKMRAEKANPKHHIMFMDSPIVTQAKLDGLNTQLDPALVPNLSSIYPEFVLEDGFGVGLGLVASAIGFATQFEKPASWADLWRPDASRKVGVVDFKLTMGPMFLSMAGAIKSGKRPEEALFDPDVCFAGMKDLRPNIHSFWTSDAQTLQLAVNGELWWVACMNSKSIIPLIDKGLKVDFAVPKEGAFALLNSATVVKGSSDEKLAMQVLNLILSEDYQTILTKYIAVAPTNTKLPTPPSLAGKVPSGPEGAKTLIQLDWKWITSQRDQWTERWNKEIAG